jgi:hypothetical protein
VFGRTGTGQQPGRTPGGRRSRHQRVPVRPRGPWALPRARVLAVLSALVLCRDAQQPLQGAIRSHMSARLPSSVSEK